MLHATDTHIRLGSFDCITRLGSLLCHFAREKLWKWNLSFAVDYINKCVKRTIDACDEWRLMHCTHVVVHSINFWYKHIHTRSLSHMANNVSCALFIVIYCRCLLTRSQSGAENCNANDGMEGRGSKQIEERRRIKKCLLRTQCNGRTTLCWHVSIE